MEKRIDLEKRGRPASQITELNLDNCRSTNIVGLNEEFVNLKQLSLINVGLTSLKGFPKLPNLKKLELSDNRISNGLNYLEVSPNITHLNLSGNRLNDLDALKPLENFKHLEVLDLFNNEVTVKENYREKTFQMLPSLKYLDGFDSKDMEAPSDADDDEEVNGYANPDNYEGSGESGEEDEDDDEDDEDEDDEENADDDDNGDVSLSEVYNDDIEEDNSDWNEENEEAGEEGDDDIDSDEDAEEGAQQPKDGEEDGAAAAPAAAEEESPARGKKRKHDG
ncbi:acidic leucine-rich nuclear phosphoprotein 32 family member A isoform X1 [Phlebotomus argentipes]|uniref:acidic leucine-rich nuclear phosphoprotein 32 family member A isoform X1 n=1 Tax=Phlebotomus argentipes TaxID=94469 RepID=UPI002892FC7C|nr:acidic leucine-rich nuclear phosphoprotein 32 family member A isoform X1 [Phlebotomus argentipes]